MSKSLHHQIVVLARDIITDPSCWVSGELARTADGHSIDPLDARAFGFCAVGALRRAAHELAADHARLADSVQTLLEEYVYRHHPSLDETLEELNDEGDHSLIVGIFDDFLGTHSA